MTKKFDRSALSYRIANSIRSAALNHSALFRTSVVIGAVVVIAGAIITGACVTTMGNGDQSVVEVTTALVICAAVGAGFVAVIGSILSAIDGVGFRFDMVGLVNVGVAALFTLFVGAVVGAVCGFAFLDREIPGDLQFNTYSGSLFGFMCATVMTISAIITESRASR
ncbi:hypothetical protein [Spirillospora sp. CA-128828]|uniref:hypothetical protein n=1 Tax=Spirillospora sp. CA-128828 TaxID=3240033 RepID=UPI003D8A9580